MPETAIKYIQEYSKSDIEGSDSIKQLLCKLLILSMVNNCLSW